MTTPTTEPVTLEELRELREWVEESEPQEDYVYVELRDVAMRYWTRSLSTIDRLIAAKVEEGKG